MLNLAYHKNKIPKAPYIELLKEPDPREGFVEREQFNALISHIPENLKPVITFLYYCGGRKGEAFHITWDQVDLKQAVIELKRGQTKTKKPRFVPLPDVLVKMLRGLEPKTGLVFNRDKLRAEWGRACAASGLGTLTKIEGRGDKRYHGLTIHDFRRSAIRNLTLAGVPEKTAMEITGHKTRAVFDRYNIVSKTQVLDAMRRVEQAQDSKVGENVVKISATAEKEVPQLVESVDS